MMKINNRIITIVTFIIFILFFTYLHNEYQKYLKFKNNLYAYKEYIEFIIPSNHIDILDRNNRVSNDNIKKITKWMNYQFELNDFVIPSKDTLSIEYNNKEQVAYILISNFEDGKLHNTPFNIRSKYGIYTLKKNFFARYLLNRRYSIVLGNMISKRQVDSLDN